MLNRRRFYENVAGAKRPARDYGGEAPVREDMSVLEEQDTIRRGDPAPHDELPVLQSRSSTHCPSY